MGGRGRDRYLQTQSIYDMGGRGRNRYLHTRSIYDMGGRGRCTGRGGSKPPLSRRLGAPAAGARARQGGVARGRRAALPKLLCQDEAAGTARAGVRGADRARGADTLTTRNPGG